MSKGTCMSDVVVYIRLCMHIAKNAQQKPHSENKTISFDREAHLSLRMVTALFNAALLTANWTVVDGNRTWIACDEGSSGTIAGWQQVRFRSGCGRSLSLAVVTLGTP